MRPGRRPWWVPVAVAAVVSSWCCPSSCPWSSSRSSRAFTPLPDGAAARAACSPSPPRRGARSATSSSPTRRGVRPRSTPTCRGSGPTRRVVVHDTLLDRGRDDEVRAVVAHELGHVVAHDVRTGTRARRRWRGARRSRPARPCCSVAVAARRSAHVASASDPAVVGSAARGRRVGRAARRAGAERGVAPGRAPRRPALPRPHVRTRPRWRAMHRSSPSPTSPRCGRRGCCTCGSARTRPRPSASRPRAPGLASTASTCRSRSTPRRGSRRRATRA